MHKNASGNIEDNITKEQSQVRAVQETQSTTNHTISIATAGDPTGDLGTLSFEEEGQTKQERHDRPA